MADELMEPMHGMPLLFWLNGMADEAGGIPGYFTGSSYWSADGADAYAPGEVWRWVYQRTASGATRRRTFGVPVLPNDQGENHG